MPHRRVPLRYYAYLLRLWQEQPASPDSPPVWHCSLEDADTHRRRGFADPEELAAFLRNQMAQDAGENRRRRENA